MYSIFRLIVIALMITYFIGTMFLYISNESGHYISNSEMREVILVEEKVRSAKVEKAKALY